MKISENCYVIYGLAAIAPWMVNAGFITGRQKTLVVDCGGNYLSAKTIYGYAKNIRPQNELTAINTEPHFDHMGGNCFFAEKGVDIYGHKNINRKSSELEQVKDEYNLSILDKRRQAVREENLVFYKTCAVNPNKKAAFDFSMDLGGITAEIILTPGHTSMNLSVYIPKEGILYCGDTIVTDYIPNLDDGGKDDWKCWLNSLQKIARLSPKIIIPGHGEILEGYEIEKEISRMRSIINLAILERSVPAYSN